MAIREIEGEFLVGINHADERNKRHHKVIEIGYKGEISGRCHLDN